MTRRAFDQGQLSGEDLVKLMHGLARMPRYAPNTGWLAALATATQQQLQDITPGEFKQLGTQLVDASMLACGMLHTLIWFPLLLLKGALKGSCSLWPVLSTSTHHLRQQAACQALSTPVFVALLEVVLLYWSGFRCCRCSDRSPVVICSAGFCTT